MDSSHRIERIELNHFVHLVGGNEAEHHSLAQILKILETIMATLKEVQDALAQAAVDATTEKAEVAAAIQSLSDQIKALQDQIAGGAGVTAADLDGLLVSIQGIDQQVRDITVPAVPTP